MKSTNATKKKNRPAAAPTALAVADVAENAREHFEDVLHPQAVSIFTPFQKRVPLASVGLADAVVDFVARYEPRASRDGLYPAQAELLARSAKGEGPNHILTTATGSGKSLCFWTWVVSKLLEDPEATALVCFPTQALMWGQANRLARVADEESLVIRDHSAFGGEVEVGGQRLGWTVWKGNGGGWVKDEHMTEHSKSESFANARIRIATMDKAHFSLLKWDKEFTRRLTVVVIDETHSYSGVFGANVHYFLKRLYAARALMGLERPAVFLASATLNDARSFAQVLLSIADPKAICHVADTVKQVIEVTSIDEAIALLRKPPPGGLLRIVLLLDEDRGDCGADGFIGKAAMLGSEANVLFFVDSKFRGRRLATSLRHGKKGAGREVVVYDADLKPFDRRQVEARFNEQGLGGATLIATNALELGVDIEGLDVCVLDSVPSARQSLLQRIGRVGRRDGRPGLVIVPATLAPQGRELLDNPTEAFRLDKTKTMPLPTHVDMIRWRHMLAAYVEGLYRDYAQRDWSLFEAVMKAEFGECPSLEDLKGLIFDAFGNAVDMDGKYFAHGGFRASASQGRIPLVELGGFNSHGAPVPKYYDGERNDVAWIEDVALFRDGHPEGVFLAHDGSRWRIAAYGGDWKVAKNEPTGTGVVLGKWLKTIKAVFVVRIDEHVATQGLWEDHHTLYEQIVDLPATAHPPVSGGLTYGVWDFSRKWRGYTLIDLKSGAQKRVPLAEVAERFTQAKEAGKDFPFLHTLTYRTFGWSWAFGPLPGAAAADDGLRDVLQGLLEQFFAASLECSHGDIMVGLDLRADTLAVYDTNPGGNGLSQALLINGRMRQAWDRLTATLDGLEKRGGSHLANYLERLLDLPAPDDVKAVTDAIRILAGRWQG